MLRRAAAYQAYYETMPLRASALPSGSHMRIYRRLQFGNLIDFSVLDTRQWRSDQACGDGSHTRLRGGARSGAHDDGRGAGEVALRQPRARAKARWTVIGQQVPTRSRATSAKANPEGRFSMDKWDGYVAGAPAALRRGWSRPRRRTRSSCRATCTALRRRSEARLHQPALGDRRRRVHEHVGDDDRRRQRGRARRGKRRAATTRTSSITATAAATSPAPRRPRRCAPTSRSSTG